MRKISVTSGNEDTNSLFVMYVNENNNELHNA